jgi:tRNA nucleotidyltransferase (CCA-adding enzyme)
MSEEKVTVIVTHHNADLDALAAMIAARRLYEGAWALRGQIVNPSVQRFLALHKDEFELVPYARVKPEQVGCVVVVDVRDRSRLKEYEPLLAACERVEVWDHHPPSAQDVAACRAVVEPVGACTTLLVERLKARGVELSQAEATLMVLGIYSDTGQLTYDSTQPRDVEAVAWLLRQGANLRVVQRYLQEEFSGEQQALMLSLMSQLREVTVDSVEVAIAVGRAPDFVNGANLVVHRVMEMGGHDAIFGVLAFEKGRRVQVVGRSRVPYVDVGELLRGVGGGGHAGAAAASFKGVSAEEIVERLEQALREAKLRPARVSDLMSAPAQVIAHDASLVALDELLCARRIRGVMVMRDGAMIGVISIRDLARAKAAGELETRTVGSYMSHHVKAIGPDEPIEDALELMTRQDVGRLPVVDAGGALLGVISRSDVLRRLYGQATEEIGWSAPAG